MLSSRCLLALAAALSLSSSACVVRWTDEPLEDDRFDDDASSTGTGFTTASGGGTTSAGGSGGEGGAGGSGATSGAGGGGLVCVDDVGTGASSYVCEDLAISGTQVGVCADGWEPLGYAACYRAFEIWEPGFAEELASCLATIPAEDACEEAPVVACIEDLYANSCEMTFIEDTCQSWATTCSEYGEALDAPQCYSDLTPFNDDGILELTDCMNEVDGTCQERYDTCFAEVAAVD